jgi:osmotically-inducible protein OsmY
MKSDTDVKRDVEAELRWRPDIDERDIAVKVSNSVVTLTGFTHSFLDKQRAEDAVKRVAGVAGVANDIEVRLGDGNGLSDPEITRAAVEAIRTELPGASQNIKVLVQRGYVTLEGKVEWHYTRGQAESAVRRLRGVMGVTNSITVEPTVKPTEIRQRIESAFRRSAQIDANQITIEARGGEVTLRGKVHSWSEREEAQETAWSAPGVTQVHNEIQVSVM